MKTEESQYTLLPEPSEPRDVSIISPYGEFCYHSRVLKKCSAWFAASMSDVWWGGEPGDMPRYRYIMDIDEDLCSTLIPVHQRADEANITPSTPRNMRGDARNICGVYVEMFKCFYHQPIMIDSVVIVTHLVSLADQYGALGPVTDKIRINFFEWEDLDNLIEGFAHIFLNLGYKMKSVRIFREAFVHVVGTWDIKEQKYPKNDSGLPYQEISEPLLTLVTSEVGRLKQLVADAMLDFLALNNHGAYTHRVQTLVRNELGRCFDRYAELGIGHEGVLFRSIVNSSFQPLVNEFPDLDKEMLAALQHQASGLVSKVKGVAKALAKNNSGLKEEVDHLTCAEIARWDLPWDLVDY